MQNPLKSCAVIKAGKAMSKANRSTLQSIYTNLGSSSINSPKKNRRNRSDQERNRRYRGGSRRQALETQQKPATDPVQKAAEPAAEPAGLTVEAVGKMVET